MLKEDLRQIFAEKLLLKGRMPQFEGCGEPSVLGERGLLLIFPMMEEIWWNVLLQPQLGGIGELVPGEPWVEREGVGGSEADFKSQCLFVKTGTSANAQ
jgi:hypothetical protein